jgi:hypothetical protein
VLASEQDAGKLNTGPTSRRLRGKITAVAENETRWWLDNAEKLNELHPDSFFIPPKARRHSLALGDAVKLIFRFEPIAHDASAERMWVDVRSVEGERYAGELVNQPKYIRSLQPGSIIKFGPEHIASVAVSEEEVGYDVEAWAAVSRRIRDEAAWPHFVYRNPPSLRAVEDRDSGWQLWARQDDDAYVAVPENVISWELGWIADKFPAVEELFRSGVEEGQWWWDDDAQTYRRRA